MKIIKDTVVWITGASSGIGRALAEQASARGARLVLSARRADALEAVRRSCPDPDRHLVVPLDLRQGAPFAGEVERVLDRFGRVDVLVNNGGVSQRAPAVDTNLDVDRALMETNFLGPVALTKAVLPSMRARHAGHIVVVSSLAGKFATPLRSAYAASKHALHGFYDALRAELQDDGIEVTIVCPGYIKTDISVNALTGDGTPTGTMDRGQAQGLPAEACAARILQAVERGKHEVLIGGTEVLGVYVKRFFPRLFDRIIRRVSVTG